MAGKNRSRLRSDCTAALALRRQPASLAASSQPARTRLKVRSRLLLEILPHARPLPSDIVTRLRSDSTAALAASLILAGSFPDIVSWALRAFAKSGEPKASVPADSGGKNRHAPKPQPAVKSDQTLLAVMRANPGASLADLIRLGRRPRTSTVLSLKRLEEAGLVEHPTKGVYRTVEQTTPPKPAWLEPLSGSHVARHAADGRVRDEMTMA
jgi:hypothetical protein